VTARPTRGKIGSVRAWKHLGAVLWFAAPFCVSSGCAGKIGVTAGTDSGSGIDARSPEPIDATSSEPIDAGSGPFASGGGFVPFVPGDGAASFGGSGCGQSLTISSGSEPGRRAMRAARGRVWATAA
jgi:hypothetical protein